MPISESGQLEGLAKTLYKLADQTEGQIKDAKKMGFIAAAPRFEPLPIDEVTNWQSWEEDGLRKALIFIHIDGTKVSYRLMEIFQAAFEEINYHNALITTQMIDSNEEADILRRLDRNVWRLLYLAMAIEYLTAKTVLVRASFDLFQKPSNFLTRWKQTRISERKSVSWKTYVKNFEDALRRVAKAAYDPQILAEFISKSTPLIDPSYMTQDISEGGRLINSMWLSKDMADVYIKHSLAKNPQGNNYPPFDPLT